MKESNIERAVVDHARSKYGALVYKFTSPSKRSVPDRMFIRSDGTVFFIEFKAPGKKCTPDQLREHARLRHHSAEVHIIDDAAKGKALVDLNYGYFGCDT